MKTLENINKYLKEEENKKWKLGFDVSFDAVLKTDDDGYALDSETDKIEKDLTKFLKKKFKNVRVMFESAD